MQTIYLAGALFSEAEQEWHIKTKQRLLDEALRQNKELKLIWLYELITQEEIASLGTKSRFEIFNRCKKGLDESNIVIALLDGTQVDDGTAWEIGYFFGTKKTDSKIIGIRTDFRSAGESDEAVVNAMIEMACDKIVYNREELVSELFAWL